MQNLNHSGTGAVADMIVSAAAVAKKGIVKQIQLGIEYSARSARRMACEQSTRASLEETLIPGGWSTSKTFKMRRKTVYSGNTVLWSIQMKKWSSV